MNDIARTATPGSWTRLAPLDQVRSHVPVLRHGQYFFLFGGGGPDFRSLDAVIRYEWQSGHIDRCRSMPTARSGTIGSDHEQRMWITGGGFKQPNGQFRFLNTVEIYDPQADTWDAGPPMLQPHDYPGGVVAGGYLYIFGGHHPAASTSGPKTDPGFPFCERLSLTQERWEALPPLPTPRFALNALERNGQIWTLGGVAFTPQGFNNYTLIESFDPLTRHWQKVLKPALPWPAAGQGNCFLNNRLYIIGGYSGQGIHARVAYYDFTDQRWYEDSPLPEPRAAMGIATDDQSIYVFGGWKDDMREPTDTVFRYEPGS